METEGPQQEILELAYPYAVDAVTDDERDEIEASLLAADPATTEAFAHTVRAIRECMVSMTVVDSLQPAQTLETTILRALDKKIHDDAAPARSRRARRFLWPAAAAAAAVVIAAGVGITMLIDDTDEQPRRTFTAEQVLAQSDTLVRAVAIRGGGTATVATSARIDAAAVDMTGAPILPAGRVYQLWFVPRAGSPRSAAVLTESIDVVTGFDSSTVLAVTVEPSGGSPQPTSTPIFTVELG